MCIEVCANEQVIDADIIVITASVSGDGKIFTSRLQLGDKNTRNVQGIDPHVGR
jgi:malate/lactate dehydrogenase